ncbi:unnamed protein product [Orchesella dallaii]|uniref:Uncharacterized protein n=1 Tax=Orchesella dallaii TaxID=48710 RepID=A0ABP1S1A1_9HEXA
MYILHFFLLQVFVFVASSSENETPKFISSHGKTQENLDINSREGDGVIQGWIRGRRSKVLDKPLESQVEFREQVDGASSITKNDHDSLSISTAEEVPTFLLSNSNTNDASLGIGTEKIDMQKTDDKEAKKSSTVEPRLDIPVVRIAGIQRQNKNVEMISSKINQNRRLRTKGPIRRQEVDHISIVTEAPALELTSVSPLESSLGGLTDSTSALSSSSSSSYMDFVKNYTTSVVMPRAYHLVNEVADHENCVERISCEISARYLHNEWNGSWRSIVNKGWISRFLSYLWSNHPTVNRIARSLGAAGFREEETRKFQQDTDHTDNISSRSCTNPCGRYICQPKSFLNKYFS